MFGFLYFSHYLFGQFHFVFEVFAPNVSRNHHFFLLILRTDESRDWKTDYFRDLPYTKLLFFQRCA